MRTIGCGVFIKKDNQILLGRRGPHCIRGHGSWALPGGGIENDESIIQGANREIDEETGLKVRWGQDKIVAEPTLLAISDHVQETKPEWKANHISFWLLAHYIGGEAAIKEPDRCLEWQWFDVRDVMSIFCSLSPDEEQYYWIPIRLWERILDPYFTLKS